MTNNPQTTRRRVAPMDPDAVAGFKLFCERHGLVVRIEYLKAASAGSDPLAQAGVYCGGSPVRLSRGTRAFNGEMWDEWSWGATYKGRRPKEDQLIGGLLQAGEPHAGCAIRFGSGLSGLPPATAILPDFRQLYQEEGKKPVVPTEVDF